VSTRQHHPAALAVRPPADSFLCGLFGSGIAGSLSPTMHEVEGASLGLRYVYRAIDFAVLGRDASALPDMLAAAAAFGFNGLNITHPFKQAIIPFLDELSADARAIGAVNTVVFQNGQRIGHNTDWWGFAENFRRGLPDAKLGHVVQIGAGGAGAAVAHAMLVLGAQDLVLYDLDRARAETLAAGLTARFGAGRARVARALGDELSHADGLVQTSPVGMQGHPGLPVPAEALRPPLWVAEVIYFPLETELLRCARAAGCRTLDGGGMAVLQAAEALRLFTGRMPDIPRMLRRFYNGA
jgi:shikimate dehydrogenase